MTRKPQWLPAGSVGRAAACPDCGAATSARSDRRPSAICWLCRRRVPADQDANAFAVVGAPPRKYRPLQFGIGTMMLMMILAALYFALYRVAVPLTVVVGIVVAPALVRALWATRYSTEPLSTMDTLVVFGQSLAAILAASIAAIGALLVASMWGVVLGSLIGFVFGLDDHAHWAIGFGIAVLCGGLGSVTTFILTLRLLWRLWPPKSRRDRAIGPAKRATLASAVRR